MAVRHCHFCCRSDAWGSTFLVPVGRFRVSPIILSGKGRPRCVGKGGALFGGARPFPALTQPPEAELCQSHLTSSPISTISIDTSSTPRRTSPCPHRCRLHLVRRCLRIDTTTIPKRRLPQPRRAIYCHRPCPHSHRSWRATLLQPSMALLATTNAPVERAHLDDSCATIRGARSCTQGRSICRDIN